MKISEKTYQALPPNLKALFRKLPNPGSEEVLSLFPREAGAFAPVRGTEPSTPAKNTYGTYKRGEGTFHNDSGSAARFFYCAKASKKDRDEGLEDAEDQILARSTQAQADAKRDNNLWDERYTVDAEAGAFNKARLRKNHHPTVKPTALMRYLCRLVTPPGGIIVDNFMGSGSTGKAAILEGFRFIGVDKDTEHGYFEIARLRMEHALKQSKPYPGAKGDEQAHGKRNDAHSPLSDGPVHSQTPGRI